MNYNTFSELREAANGYLWLLQNFEFGHDEQTDEIVICFHKIISNINFNEIREKLEKGNVNQLAIIERLVEPILNILEKLIDIIGGNMPRIKSNVDPDVGTVFRFCKDIDTIFRNEYENLKSRRNSDPTFADEDAVEKLQLFGSGSYGDMALDDFVKEYIIKGLSHIAVVRRIKYMISQCTDEHIQRGLRKFLYWRKCDEDVIAELHDAFCDFCRFYDYATDVSHIPSDGNRDDVVARMFGVMEWCKQHDNELKMQLVNRSLLKDVEDLFALATHICESADNWCSAIGNDASTLGLINEVAIILDNAIAPTIKQRTSTSTPVPELHPLTSIQVTAKENATLPDFSHMDSFTPTIPFDISALYTFLINESVIKNIDFSLFTECITHAYINELWHSCYVIRKRKRNLLQSLFKLMAEYYPDKWITKCADNLNLKKKQITNPTSSGETTKFEDRLRQVLKGKSINY